MSCGAGRVDDVINVSGHRIGTAEVESALVNHPACAEAAVVPVEHPIKGQGIYAFVTLMEVCPQPAKLYKLLRCMCIACHALERMNASLVEPPGLCGGCVVPVEHPFKGQGIYAFVTLMEVCPGPKPYPLLISLIIHLMSCVSSGTCQPKMGCAYMLMCLSI